MPLSAPVQATQTVPLGLTAIVAALPTARASRWTPFAPHGWLAIGTAANLLMLSFVGWEAVAHLAGEFADPLPEEWRDRLDLVDRTWAMRQVHLPESIEASQAARRRLVLD